MSKNIKRARSGDVKDKSSLKNQSKLPQEIEEGNIEYKRQLINIDPDRFDHLVSQLKWRLREGQGEAIYEIGIDDDGFPIGLIDKDFDESLMTLEKMVKQLNADLTLLHEKDVNLKNEKRKRVAEILVRQYSTENYLDLRITICGNVDSGKSTLIGVLTTGKMDNGKGEARSNVFVHKHELLTGRTSSINYQILGYDIKGKIVNYSDIGTMDWKDIVENSSKIVTFIDLAGHTKYLKTTVSGITGTSPDYSCLVIASNVGVTSISKEHLGLTLHMKVPSFIVITKVDICPKMQLENTINQIKTILKLPGVRKVPYVVKKDSDIVLCSKNILTDRLCPIFLVSNVTGSGLILLKQFLNLLPIRKDWNMLKNKPFEFMVDQTFYVTGIGTVVSGLMLQGTISTHDKGLLGPDDTGCFKEIQIKSIHHKRTPVKCVSAGQHVCLAIRKERRSSVRKGMVFVEEKFPKAIWEFESEMLVLYHSTKLKSGYQPVIHTLSVKQSVKVLSIVSQTKKGEDIKTGDKAVIRLRFLYKPEFLKPNTRVIFREGRTKGIGIITKLFHE